MAVAKALQLTAAAHDADGDAPFMPPRGWRQTHSWRQFRAKSARKRSALRLCHCARAGRLAAQDAWPARHSNSDREASMSRPGCAAEEADGSPQHRLPCLKYVNPKRRTHEGILSTTKSPGNFLLILCFTVQSGADIKDAKMSKMLSWVRRLVRFRKVRQKLALKSNPRQFFLEICANFIMKHTRN